MGTYYIGIVDRGGEGWGVTFPDLPGCTSGGKDAADLFTMSIEAIRLWADGHLSEAAALPRPRTLDALLADAGVKELIEAVGPISFIQVPPVRDAGRQVRANISLDFGVLQAIDAAADRLGKTRSAFLVDAARDKIGRDD